jgi:uncharacterized protein (TIGR03437 family)
VEAYWVEGKVMREIWFRRQSALRRFRQVWLLSLLVLGRAPAQVIVTVAGGASSFPTGPISGLDAPLGRITGVALDSSGNLFICDPDNNMVLRLSMDGTLTVGAGNGIDGFSGDGGLAANAALNHPRGIAFDRSGSLYIADTLNHRIRKVSSSGIISTIAGTLNAGFSGDGGPATSAALSSPSAIALDSSGNLFISDRGNNRVRRVSSAGIITTVAGNATQGGSGDGGPAIQAQLFDPDGLAVDAAGNLYIADTGNNELRRVVPSGTISTVLTLATGCIYSGQCTADHHTGLALDAFGTLYIADPNPDVVRKVALQTATISNVAGYGVILGSAIFNVFEFGFSGFSGDGGPATAALLGAPSGVALDPNGNVYIADTMNHRVRKVDSSGVIRTIAGNGQYRYSGDGGPGTLAALNEPFGVAVDANDNVLISDSGNMRVRRLTPDGVIQTIAGNGFPPANPGLVGTVPSIEGNPAISTPIANLAAIAVDSAGTFYFHNEDQLGAVTTLRVKADGTIYHVGNAVGIGPGTTSGVLQRIPPPTLDDLGIYSGFGIAADNTGFLYQAFGFLPFVERVSSDTGSNGNRTIGSQASGYGGDGGAAGLANLNNPTAIAIGPFGKVYIADSGNARVRMVTPDNVITTVAGNGSSGYSGDGGPAISAAIGNPQGLTVDARGNLYVADPGNNVVRKVAADGSITTVAGNGTRGFTGDGSLGPNASLAGPYGVAVDSAGNIYIADSDNNRIRKVLASKPGMSLSTSSLSFTGQSLGARSATQTFVVSASVPGLLFSAAVNADGANWLTVSPQSGAAAREIEVAADPGSLSPGTYHGTITVTAPDALSRTATVDVTFVVGPPVPATLAVDSPTLSFSFPRLGAARSQGVTVSNTGGGSLNFTVAAATSGGGKWLSTSASAGIATPNSPVVVSVTADPTGLLPGTYTGAVSVNGVGGTVVPVTMTISSLDRAIVLTQRGLSFLAVANGGVTPPQSFSVLNIGAGSVDWTVATSTLSGGGWLQATPSVGSTGASGALVPVTVSVDASKLGAGSYYGLITVSAPAAANSPQVLTVFLQVLPAGTDIGPVAQPGGLLFNSAAGGDSPGSQNIQVYNLTGTARSFHANVAADRGLTVAILPSDGKLDPLKPFSIVVQPFTRGLPQGTYSATITVQFSNGRVSRIGVSVIIGATGAAAAVAPLRSRARLGEPSDSNNCTPSKLLPTLTTLAASFQVSAGWPVALGVTVKDDCGAVLDSGSVTVTFSNGDPPVVMQSLQDGRWEGTWSTQRTLTSQVTLKLHAENLQAHISGEQQVSGGLQSQQQPPVFEHAGVVSTAGGPSYVAVAPGAMISIYGDRLAESATSASDLPLPTQLVDTQVFMAGVKLPLDYVSETQINAVVPYRVNTNAPQQLLVQRGLTYSLPVSIDVAPAQPSIFNGGPPQLAALMYAYPSDGSSPHLVNSAAPAHAGDVVSIFCSGLGPVSPAVPDGAAPADESSLTSNNVQLLIDGQPAQVTFAGLTPGFAGLYQVNAVVPQGTGTGSGVPMVVTVAGQSSPQVTMTIQ